MRLTSSLVTVLLVGLSLSCGEGPTGITDDSVLPPDDGIRLSTVLSAKGSNAAEVEWRAFAFTVEGCGEDVDVEGFSHNLGKSQIRGKNGPTTVLRVSAHGFGVGQTSRARYVFSDKITYSSGEESGVGNYVGVARQFQLIGQGRAPDLHFYGVVEIIFDESGNVTFEVQDATQICK